MPPIPKVLFLFLISIFLFSSIGTLAQSGTHEADRVPDRENWFRSGRTVKGENAADLLHRAYKEKLNLRAAREAAARRNASAAQREDGRSLPESFATPNFSNL